MRLRVEKVGSGRPGHRIGAATLLIAVHSGGDYSVLAMHLNKGPSLSQRTMVGGFAQIQLDT